MMKRWLTVLLALSLLFSLAAGCGSQAGSKPGGNAPKKLEKVTVLLDWTPNTNHTGIYAAKALGYFKDEGLDVEIIQPGSGGVPQMVAADQAQLGFSYQEEVTIARSEGVPVQAVAAVLQHNTSGFAAPAAKKINRPRDFEGKRYGGWGSPAEAATLRALMEADGADFNKVKIVNIGSADFFTSVRKDVDFAWIFYGWTGIEAELKGIKLSFIKLNAFNPVLDYYTPVLICGESTLKQDPILIRKMLKAISRGYVFAAENPDRAAKILIGEVPELNPELVGASQKYLSPEYIADAPRWGEMKAERWESYGKWMTRSKLLSKPFKAEGAFSNQYLPE